MDFYTFYLHRTTVM